jgi:hypothetical protein
MCKKLVINYFNTTLGEIKFYGRKVKYYINIEKFIPNQNYTEILTKELYMYLSTRTCISSIRQ